MVLKVALLAAAQLGEKRRIPPDVRSIITESATQENPPGKPWGDSVRPLVSKSSVNWLPRWARRDGGGKIRATLAARAASIRRHELANAEAEANAD